jgi:glycosyltransferase involved in cell wall biosynthesis
MRLSVIIPVFNEVDQCVATVRSMTATIGESDAFGESEIVVVDDGSAEDIATPVLAAATTVPVRVERLPQNSGRFAARQVGLAAAEGEYVLFVDAGVTVEPGGLAFIGERLDEGRDVWNAHTILNTGGNPFALFWGVVSLLAFGDYVDNPRETSFGVENFDRFPKGTGCFFAPRELLVLAFASFRSQYSNVRNANDDAPIIRTIAEHRPINIAPGFACVYTPRRTLRSFVRHALHRGVVFVDGHGRRESRFFPIVVAFFPISVGIAAVAVRRPIVLPIVAAGIAGAAGIAAGRRRRPAAEVASFAALAPVYAVAHGLGMWRGAALLIAERLRSGT